MCGIAGIVSDRSLDISNRAIVDRMVTALEHRGGDGRGLQTLANAILGHTRLAIIAPEHGAQPIGNEDGSIWIVANCEIYNHRSLRERLVSRGHRFSTRSDAETILHSYEETGMACTDSLHGMFAFAIWDSKRRTLLLARDPIGIKPLYYAQVGQSVAFASRLDALMEHPGVERRVDLISLQNYLTYHYVPSPQTILSTVSKLGPGQRLILRDGEIQVQTYWDVSFAPDLHPTDAEWMSTIRDGLAVSVGHHLVADVPVGAFLSGGLDSSAVVATMAGVARNSFTTHTVGFDDAKFDERNHARQFAARFNTDHHESLVSPDACDVAIQLSSCFDEPFADPSAIPTMLMSRMARGFVKAVLSGDGGDELFAGYTRYLRHHRERLLRRVAGHRLARGIVRAIGVAGGSRAKSAARNLVADADYAHYLSVAWFDPDETRSLVRRDVLASMADYDPFEVLRARFVASDVGDPLARGQYVDLKTWLADGVLCKVDRASMAFGLEVRVPMLDAAFVKTVAGLPSHLKIRSGRGKFALRRAMAPMLGDDVVERPKHGFEVPLDDWVTGPMSALFQDTVLSPGARIATWIDPESVRTQWRMLSQGRPGMGARMWALLMLELWSRRHLESPNSTPPAHGERSRELVGTAS